MLEGEQNTTYFHACAIIRGVKKKIDGLRLENGDWCTDQTQLPNMVLQFYCTLYSEDNSSHQVSPLPKFLP